MKRFLKPINLLWLLLIPVAVLLARSLPWGEIAQVLLTLTLAEVLVLLAVNGLILLLFSTRWWLILRAYAQVVPYLKLSAYRVAGFAISYLTPGTQFGGEPLQAYMVQSRHAVSASISVAAVAIDKVIELFANFAFLGLGILLTVSNGIIPGLAFPNLAAWVFVFMGIPVIYFLALWIGKRPLAGLLQRLPAGLWRQRRLSKLPTLAKATEERMAELFRQRPLLFLWTILISALVWGLMVFEYWLMAYFLGARLTLLQAVAGYTAMRVSFLAPVPGGLGMLEASQVLALEAFGYSAALGISISLLIRARDLFISLFGLWIGSLVGVRSAQKPQASQETITVTPAVREADFPQGTLQAGD